MELLIGAIVSLIVEFIKWLTGKFQMEFIKPALILTVFALSLAGSIVYLILKANVDTQILLTVWATAIGFYEVVIKTVIKPVLNKLNKK